MTKELQEDINKLFGNASQDDSYDQLVIENENEGRQSQPTKVAKNKKKRSNGTSEEAFQDKSSVHIHTELASKAIRMMEEYKIRLITLENEDDSIVYLQDENTKAYSILNTKALEKRIKKYLSKEQYYLKEAAVTEMGLVMIAKANDTVMNYEDVKDNILVNNGFIKIEDGKLRFVEVPKERLGLTYALRRIDLDYKEDLYKESCPVVEKFFSDIMMNDHELEEFLWKALATPFIARNKYEKAFVLYGESGANGKTVLANLMSNVYAKRNISHVELAEMKEYNLAIMERAMVNWVQDLEKYNDWPNFKKIVSGESIVVNVKYSDPVEKEISSQIFINSNILPKLGSKRDGGYLRRLEFIPFNKTFRGAEKDAQIIQKLTKKENLEWILSKLISIVKELEDDYAGAWFSENRPDAVKAIYKEQQENDSSALSFIKWLQDSIIVDNSTKQIKFDWTELSYIERETVNQNSTIGEIMEKHGHVIYRGKLYKTYLAYCSVNGIKKPMQKPDFERHLKEVKELEFKPDTRVSASKGIYIASAEFFGGLYE